MNPIENIIQVITWVGVLYFFTDGLNDFRLVIFFGGYFLVVYTLSNLLWLFGFI